MNVRAWFSPEKREQSRIERRVAKIKTPELLSWAELAADGLCRELSEWRRSEASFHLQEATLGAESLVAALKELSRRQGLL